jgi:hypothetical protein
MVIENAALLNRHVTHMTPPHFSAAVYTGQVKWFEMRKIW